MKVIGIDIASRDVRMVVLDDASGEIVNCTGKYKPLKLEDDHVAENVRLFKNTLFATLDGFAPDVVVFNHRGTSGMYASSPISFKIEGLIQLYENAEIRSTKPQTLAAFYKKNKLTIACDYQYQTDALKLCFHHINVK